MMIGIGDCALDGVPEMLFQRVTKKFEIWRARVASPVPLLLDADDAGRACVAGEQIPAVVGFQEAAQRLHPTDDQHEVVLIAEREHGIDQIMPRTLPTQLNFQALREKVHKFRRNHLLHLDFLLNDRTTLGTYWPFSSRFRPRDVVTTFKSLHRE